MPLREVQFTDAASLRSEGERFFVFFSSRLPESNSLWCPDCRAVEDLIRKTFGSEQDPPSAVIVYVGQRSEWKAPDNVFRQDPWKVTTIPTIIKLDEAGKEVARLVDGLNLISKELPSFTQ
ncbi:hypothetical protein EV363DRAFT_1151665 [Boletus edulis]|nr:hypothetical protein EV363DRAFT_1151665 [Boletus edulis]